MLVDIIESLILSLPLVGAYAIFAIGIVLIYRASRMLNLAHGAMAMVPAYVLYELVRRGVPTAIAFPFGIAFGALLGLAVERVFVSRLRRDGPTAQTVGTVAALGIMVAVAVRLWGTAGLPAVEIFPRGRISVGASALQIGELGLFGVMLIVGAALFVMIQRTDIGLMMRGTAESRLAASLMGVNPDRMTSLAWMLGGALAALAGILLAAVTSLHPYALSFQVIPAFIAALVGGLGSLPGALVGAAIVGAVQGLVPLFGSLGKLQGAPQLFLAALAIVVMATRGKSLVGADDAPTATASVSGGRKRRATESDTDRARRRVLIVAAIVGLVVFPYLPGVPSSVVAAGNLAAVYAVVAVSLVVLTGWVGQISLGHAALVGVGAYATGHIVERLGIPFPVSLPLAALVSGAFAALLGGVAVRVRGLYLAVATLVFAWMASEFLFRQPWFIRYDQIGERPLGEPGALPFFDFSDRRTFFLVASATAALAVFGAANLRDSKTGRAFFALRGSEMAAASLGIDVVRYKFVAFVTSGAIAGAAGNLLMTDARVVTPDQFTFNISLFYVAIAVVGGLTSLSGAVASAVLFAALAEVFYRVAFLGAFLEIVSSLLLATVLIVYPGGLASLPARLGTLIERLRPRVEPGLRRVIGAIPARPRTGEPLAKRVASLSRPRIGARSLAQATARTMSRLPLGRLRPAPQLAPAAPLDFKAALRVHVDTRSSDNGHAPATSSDPGLGAADIAWARSRVGQPVLLPPREDRLPLISAEHVTVQFGGLTAVNDASLKVCEGEIVGLIGPNGAGKTTFFNAIAGYNSPTAGTVRLYGHDVTDLPVHRRARVGVARTFQLIQLFRELTVYENLLVATHVHNPTGFGSHLLVTQSAIDSEAQAIDRVNEVMELLDLTALAERTTGDLPFGVLRMIEVARALVTGFRVVMLDEPASGLDNAETDKLIEVLRFVRGLGVTLLLIEHDVRMVTGVSDYMYVLEQGRIIAEGTPDLVQRDPLVIAAYLGEPAGTAEKEPVG